MAEVCPYVFRLSVAPLSAAWAERKSIRVATIIRAFHALRQKHPLVVVEGVGGLHVPITSSLHVSDLIYQMKLSAVVVGQSGLGGINHALLTLHALRQRKIPIVALVLNQRRPVLTKTARVQEQSTITLLRRLREGSCGRSPRLQPECEYKLERWLGPHRGDRSDHEAGEAGPGSWARNVFTAWLISGALRIAEMTATPSAPARITSPTWSI